jgi:hypothetical protein
MAKRIIQIESIIHLIPSGFHPHPPRATSGEFSHKRQAVASYILDQFPWRAASVKGGRTRAGTLSKTKY